MKPVKLLFALGTRPEAVKLAPLILAAKADPRFTACVVSTGQHQEMLSAVLSQFKIKPDYDLALMRSGQSLALLNASVMGAIVAPLVAEKPDWTIVQGDTLTCAAAAMTAYLLRLRVAHVEAGLRTHDMNAPWPEEFNRRLTALTADIHFSPTSQARENLLNERVPDQQIFVTGNTGIDALMLQLDLLRTNADLQQQMVQTFSRLNSQRQLALVTVHRREAHGEPLRNILRAILKLVAARPNLEVALPVHKNPQVRSAVEEVLGKYASWNGGDSRIHLYEPLDYLSFLALMDRSTIILTDSGGVQEEAPSLKKPVLILRETTEREEAVQSGCALLVGFDEAKILSNALRLLDSAEERSRMFVNGNPFGDGQACKRILDIFCQPALRQVG